MTGLAALEAKEDTDRNLLWKIVDNCLENGTTHYCEKCPKPLPAFIAQCAEASSTWSATTLCKRTTEIWDKTSEFVALKDKKMCGCSDQNFVHGLALPRARVSGAEDTEHLPRGLWQFALDEALKKIGRKASIALVANPPRRRSQDQLHIHLVRLAERARKELNAFIPIHITSLDEVWDAAARHAAGAGLVGRAYGIAVAYQPEGNQFLVVATAHSPEELYTVYKCSP